MKDDAAAREAAAVLTEYERRDQDPALARFYARVGPTIARAHARRRRRMLRELGTLGDLGRLRVLDLGTGDGGDLAFFAAHGADAAGLVGVDLRVGALAAGPRVGSLVVADSARLPFRDATFDATTQTTMLSSILDPAVRAAVTSEMARVTRPGGLLMSFDLRRVTRTDRRLTPIDRREIARLFDAHGPVRTEAHWLDLRIASRAPRWLAKLFDVPALRSHELAVVRRSSLSAAHEQLSRTYTAYSEGRGTKWTARETGMRVAQAERDAWLARALGPTAEPILDLGCGDGNLARTLAGQGVAARYIGVDLLAERLRDARERTPGAAFARASAAQLPIAAGGVGAVAAVTLFSSLPEPWLRTRVASEIARVLRPGGRVIVYDLRYPSPGNPGVRPFPLGEMRRLFAGWRLLEARTLTVLPPLARSWLSAGARRYAILRRVPLLRSHLGVVLEKPL